MDNSFSKMRMKHRLVLCLAGMVVSISLLVGIVLLELGSLREGQKQLAERDMKLAYDFVKTRDDTGTMRSQTYFMVLNANRQQERDECWDKIKKAHEDCLTRLTDLRERVQDRAELKAKLEDLTAMFTRFSQQEESQLLPAVRNKDTSTINRLIFGELGRNLNQIVKAINSLESEALESAKNRVDKQETGTDAASVTVLFVAFISLLLAAASSWWLLKGIIAATAQLTRAVNVLGTELERIGSSINDTASGTAETAAAVNETTATVEELKQTSEMSKEKAHGVYESAQRAQQICTSGSTATERTVDGMKRIRQQMDEIAESMSNLGEKARNIVEIIATVDDLARQSNLLAVNAAIEAAKAGEHGKGFAVVAQQVEDMSKQSKQATAQVRAILEQIQTAAGSAAKATHSGSETVDLAVKESSQAGNSINMLLASVAGSAEAAAQIASASKQQAVGVEQVLTAVLGIKEAAAQNVTAIMRVEEAAAILSELGLNLQEQVDSY